MFVKTGVATSHVIAVHGELKSSTTEEVLILTRRGRGRGRVHGRREVDRRLGAGASALAHQIERYLCLHPFLGKCGVAGRRGNHMPDGAASASARPPLLRAISAEEPGYAEPRRGRVRALLRVRISAAASAWGSFRD